jgi:hypothetical protein
MDGQTIGRTGLFMTQMFWTRDMMMWDRASMRREAEPSEHDVQ